MKKSFIKNVVFACIIAITLSSCGVNKNIKTVQTSSYLDYTDKTIGEAFNGFVTNPQWTFIKDGSVVDAVGDAVFFGTDVSQMRMQFTVNQKDIELIALGITNGQGQIVALNDEVANIFFNAMFTKIEEPLSGDKVDELLTQTAGYVQMLEFMNSEVAYIGQLGESTTEMSATLKQAMNIVLENVCTLHTATLSEEQVKKYQEITRNLLPALNMFDIEKEFRS